MSKNTNGHFPNDPENAARLYLGHQVIPIPVCFKGKKPFDQGWQNLRPQMENIIDYFPQGEKRNLGLLLGRPSNGLIDVDLDADEAVRIGQAFLPPTEWISGRPSKMRSHYWYFADDSPDLAADTYQDLDGTMLVELRSTGGHTVAPPSIHDSGELVSWQSFVKPAFVHLNDLRQAVRNIAAAAILARHWPSGSRQESAMALAGGLARARWDESQIEKFINQVTLAAQDEEGRHRLTTIKPTLKKLEEGKKGKWVAIT